MLADRVRLVSEQTSRFKTGRISVAAAMPLDEKAAANSLLIYLLKRSCKQYPDFIMLNGKLDELYGASVSAGVAKLGDSQVVTLSMNCIDDRFALTDESVAEQCAELLADMIFSPNCKNGSFGADNLAMEKRLLIQRIEEELNDKRTYAFNRCISYMCANEAYGKDKYGTVEEIESVKMADVYSAWKTLLSSAIFQITVVGSSNADDVADIFAKKFEKIERTPVKPETVFYRRGGHFNRYEEKFPVNQGKLVIGFRAGMTNSHDNLAAITVMNDIFGMGTYSKLFMNVREKLSLCYYASSLYHRQKGLITVSSGIEFHNYQKAFDEIMAQLAAVQNGSLEDWELEGARSTLLNAYTSMSDSQGKLENFYLGQAATDQHETPEELAQQVREVTPERIFRAMQTVKLDTVYFLQGKEAAE
jgi:predicted Zn-dependent peptidase